MPFGYCDAPRQFTFLMKKVLRHVRAQGVRAVVYIDDILIMAASEEECKKHTALLVSWLRSLGLSISWEKSELTPAQLRLFLGVLVDSLRMQFRLPQKKVDACMTAARQALADAKAGRPCKQKDLQRLIGRLQSVSDCILPTRMHLNALHEALTRSRLSPTGKTVLCELAHDDLLWWRHNLPAFNGRGVRPPPFKHSFDTDASAHGWGAVYAPRDKPRLAAQGHFTWVMTSNMRELTAIRNGLFAFAKNASWTNCAIRVRSDNLTAVSYVNKMGGRVASLSRIAEQIHSFCLSRRISLTALYLPGELNVEADALSRIEADWSQAMLAPTLFRMIDAVWGPHQLDCFASATNAQLEHYVSLRIDTDCLYPDFLGHPWPERFNCWAFPPYILLPRLLSKIQEEGAECTVLMPVWPEMPWWPLAFYLLAASPLLLPQSPDFLHTQLPQGKGTGCPKWRSIACRLSGTPARRVAFRKMVQAACSLPTKEESLALLSASILPPGHSGAQDVSSLESIRSVCESLTWLTSSAP